MDEAARIFTDEVLRPGLVPPRGVGRVLALCEAFLSYVERQVFQCWPPSVERATVIMAVALAHPASSGLTLL